MSATVESEMGSSPVMKTTLEDELRVQIQQVIRPFRSTTRKPPFSEAELVTMALASHGGPIIRDEILGWLRCRFACYRHLFPKIQGRLLFDALEASLESTFSAFDVPIRTLQQPGRRTEYTIAPNEAAICLQRALGTERKGVFRFLDLPFDIRSIVCKMVFAFPKSGIQVIDPQEFVFSPKSEFRTLGIDLLKPFTFNSWIPRRQSDDQEPTDPPVTMDMLPLNKIFALFAVSKRVRKEAMRAFFDMNTLIIPQPNSGGGWLTSIPNSHRRRLRQLACLYFPYPHSDDSDGCKIASCPDSGDTTYDWSVLWKQVAALPRLRKLYIYIDQEHWSEAHQELGKDDFDIFKIPGLEALRSIRVVVVV